MCQIVYLGWWCGHVIEDKETTPFPDYSCSEMRKKYRKAMRRWNRNPDRENVDPPSLKLMSLTCKKVEYCPTNKLKNVEALCPHQCAEPFRHIKSLVLDDDKRPVFKMLGIDVHVDANEVKNERDLDVITNLLVARDLKRFIRERRRIIGHNADKKGDGNESVAQMKALIAPLEALKAYWYGKLEGRDLSDTAQGCYLSAYLQGISHLKEKPAYPKDVLTGLPERTYDSVIENPEFSESAADRAFDALLEELSNPDFDEQGNEEKGGEESEDKNDDEEKDDKKASDSDSDSDSDPDEYERRFGKRRGDYDADSESDEDDY